MTVRVCKYSIPTEGGRPHPGLPRDSVLPTWGPGDTMRVRYPIVEKSNHACPPKNGSPSGLPCRPPRPIHYRYAYTSPPTSHAPTPHSHTPHVRQPQPFSFQVSIHNDPPDRPIPEIKNQPGRPMPEIKSHPGPRPPQGRFKFANGAHQPRVRTNVVGKSLWAPRSGGDVFTALATADSFLSHREGKADLHVQSIHPP